MVLRTAARYSIKNAAKVKIGSRIATLYTTYAKKLGIATPDFSAIDLTMKFGPFPISELSQIF